MRRARGPIVGLLLAAGRSARAKSNKLLLTLNEGSPVIVQSGRRLHEAVDRMLVIVPQQDEALTPLLAEMHWETVACEHAHRGMGHSLACGIRHTLQAQGWVVALADMPWITRETIQQVAYHLRGGTTLAVPVCAGRRGHPVGFGAIYRQALLNLQGDRGGQSILQRNAEHIVEIECDDRGILLDIDREEDLERGAG